jgi:serine/threonine protein kinase
VDVWSVGCIMLELLLGHDRFCEEWMSGYDYDIIQRPSEFEDIIGSAVENMDLSHTSRPIQDFAGSCLAMDPDKRGSAADLMKSEWMSEIEEEREVAEAKEEGGWMSCSDSEKGTPSEPNSPLLGPSEPNSPLHYYDVPDPKSSTDSLVSLVEGKEVQLGLPISSAGNSCHNLLLRRANSRDSIAASPTYETMSRMRQMMSAPSPSSTARAHSIGD